jgi:hypothetical protein
MELENNSSSSSHLSSSAYSSSSSSSSQPAPSITWVSPASLGKRWSSDVWSTDIFLVSSREIENKRKIKCLPCSEMKVFSLSPQNQDWAQGQQNLAGTSAVSHHARTYHSDLPKVAEWIKRDSSSRQSNLEQKQAVNASRKEVSVSSIFSIYWICFFSVFCLF